MQFSFLHRICICIFTLIESSVPNLATFVAFFFWPANFASLLYKLCFTFPTRQRYINIVYVGMYLVYLVLAYKERIISFVCFFLSYFCWCWARYFRQVRKLRQYSYSRAFGIVIYGKFNSNHTLFFIAFFMWSVNCASLICKDI